MKRIFTSKIILMDTFNATHCRIEVDNSDPHRPLQRHVWKKKDTGEWVADDWIKSIRFDEENRLRKGWTEIIGTEDYIEEKVKITDYNQL